jgi:preprotein translocase subunit SecE
MTNTLVQKKSKKKKVSFFRGVKEELKKVTWTSKKELKVSTKVVVISTFVFGIAIYVADLILKGALDGLSMLAKWIGG